MARVLVIGASSGIGLETTRQALAAGHEVRAFARSALGISLVDPRLEKVAGDALKSADVEAALRDVDVVIQVLGVKFATLFKPVSLFSEATRILVAAMAASSTRRLICVTGFGAGDSRMSIGLLQRLPFHLVFGHAYGDKSEQERLIKASPLDWTIVRPGVLTGGAGTGRYKVLVDAAQWRNGVISRANVADFLVRLINDRSYVGKTPVLVG